MTRAGLIQRWRRWLFARRGIVLDRSCTIGAGVSLGPPVPIDLSAAVTIGAACEIGRGVELNPWGGRIRLGPNVFVGPYVVVYGHGGVEIGEESLISMHCCILSSNHEVPPRSVRIRSRPDLLLPTFIGAGVWLGANVTVLGGSRIGEGCVVGAGSVVRGELPPFSVAAGVPARVLRMRAD
jgi:acetyltransferase-like isoleucine patch superfamily enzyme